MPNSAARNRDPKQELVEYVAQLVHEESGIQLGPKQHTMILARLTKRMIDLSLSDPTDYLHYVQHHQESEIHELVSLLTTHHTFFFREFPHFDFLEQTAIPQLIESLRAKGQKTIRIWSAACSRGQEAYSLAMFFNFHLKSKAPDFKVEIFGSDVDAQSVAIANNAVYRWDEVKEIPSIYLTENWVKGTGDVADFVRAKEHIKSMCTFSTVNLFELEPMSGKFFDLIFCRNVFIYFKEDQIKVLTKNLLKHLSPNGYFFIGMSETLNGLGLPVKSAGPAIYSHAATAIPKEATKVVSITPAKPKAPTTRAPAQIAPLAPSLQSTPVSTGSPQLIRVLAVDDSPTVITLLKKILSRDVGFEIVATAQNGIEAADALKKNKVDVVTLDIHMPKQDGVQYLENNFGPNHPPVVMISSVSREDSALGVRSLDLGAIDYIEKPTLANLADKTDEIRTKLRCAVKAHATHTEPHDGHKLEHSFEKKHALKVTDKHLRIVVAGIGEAKKVKWLFKHMPSPQPATLLMIHGSESMVHGLQDQIKKATGLSVEVVDSVPASPKQNTLYLCDFKKSFEDARKSLAAARKTSIILFGSASGDVTNKIAEWKTARLILEDLGVASSDAFHKLRAQGSHFVPHTSFIYHSDDDLMRD